MKHNEHFMSYLASLRDEAQRPETSMTRIIEIFKTIAVYSQYQ